MTFKDSGLSNKAFYEAQPELTKGWSPEEWTRHSRICAGCGYVSGRHTGGVFENCPTKPSGGEGWFGDSLALALHTRAVLDALDAL